MSKKILFLCIMLFSITSFAQKIKKLTDSSSAPGFIKENDTYLCIFTPNSCQCITGRVLDRGESLVISGAKICNDENHNNERYFTVLIDTSEYLIEADKVLTDSSFFRQIISMSQEKQTSFREYAHYVMKAIRYSKVDKVLKFVQNAKNQGIYIENWSFYDESENTEGTGIKFDVTNTAKKTIKYISFTVSGLNAVGDLVKGRSGLSIITVKGVGPIEFEQSGSYDFNYTWHTDLVQEVKILSVKIQYMDNTIKVISNPKSVIITEEHRKILDESAAR